MINSFHFRILLYEAEGFDFKSYFSFSILGVQGPQFSKYCISSWPHVLYAVLSFSFSSKYLTSILISFWIICFLEVCYLVSKYLGIFQIYFCYSFLLQSLVFIENIFCIWDAQKSYWVMIYVQNTLYLANVLCALENIVILF